MSLAQAAAALEEVEALLTAKGWKGLLVDVTTLRSVPKAEELFTFGNTLPRHLPRLTRVALVVRLDQARHARLIEQVARGGGMFLTFFTNIVRAEKWVRGKPNGRYDAAPAPGRQASYEPAQPQAAGQARRNAVWADRTTEKPL